MNEFSRDDSPQFRFANGISTKFNPPSLIYSAYVFSSSFSFSSLLLSLKTTKSPRISRIIILKSFKSTRSKIIGPLRFLHQPIEKKKSTLPFLRKRRERERGVKKVDRTVSLRGSAGARKSPRNTPGFQRNNRRGYVVGLGGRRDVITPYARTQTLI